MLNYMWVVDDDRRTRDDGCFLGISNSEIYLGARALFNFVCKRKNFILDPLR